MIIQHTADRYTLYKTKYILEGRNKSQAAQNSHRIATQKDTHMNRSPLRGYCSGRNADTFPCHIFFFGLANSALFILARLRARVLSNANFSFQNGARLPTSRMRPIATFSAILCLQWSRAQCGQLDHNHVYINTKRLYRYISRNKQVR